MEKTKESKNYDSGFDLKSVAIKKVYKEIGDYAFQGWPCILFGPPGVGKEYAARHYYRVFKETRGNRTSIEFKALNCSGLSKDLAHSELFGHVKGSFSGADRDKRGLFETARGCVLFLDEIGDLAPTVQPMLNHALNTDNPEARRLGSEKTYKIVDVTVICATEQPKERLRPSLLDRLEMQVFVPGLEKRPEDVPPAVEFFARRALAKRRDISGILQEFYQSAPESEYARLMGNPHLMELAAEIAEKLLPMVVQRSWPGNFRALRIAVDAAVIRSRTKHGKKRFLEQAVDFFAEHQGTYSVPKVASRNADGPEPQTVPVKSEDAVEIDGELLQQVHKALPRIADVERLRIVEFLAQTKGGSFSARDIHAVLTHRKIRAVQNRLKSLVEEGCIVRSGGKGDRYCLARGTLAQYSLQFKKSVFLPLPSGRKRTAGYSVELQALLELLEQSRGLFIGGKDSVGKSACVQAFGEELSRTRAVYHYEFGTKGFADLLDLIDKELQSRDIADSPVLFSEDADDPAFQVAVLSGYVRALFGEQDSPLLILDNLNVLQETTEREALRRMLRHWKNLTFVLVGNKLRNDLYLDEEISIVEYPIQIDTEYGGSQPGTI